MSEMRLQRFLSQSGVAARRKAEQLIVDGRVTVNGQVVTTLGSKVDPDRDRVAVDGQAVHPQDYFYAVLNKPKGCLTAVSDPEGRPTVMDYMPNLPVTVAPVGRLDFYSEGVLLLTNDGELSAALQAPRSHVDKTYHVKVRGIVKPSHLEAMRTGVRLDDGYVTKPAQVDRLKSDSRHDWLVITLTEGKSRQIHRMAEALGYLVLKLQRVAFGPITFHGLRVGDARELSQQEVNELRERVGLPKTTVSRGSWSAQREDSELGRRARNRQRAEAEAGGQPATRGGQPATRGGKAGARSGPSAARGGAATGRGGVATSRGAAATGRGGAASSRGGAASGRGGAASGRGAAATGRGGAASGRGAAASGRGAAASGRGAAATGRGGAAGASGRGRAAATPRGGKGGGRAEALEERPRPLRGRGQPEQPRGRSRRSAAEKGPAAEVDRRRPRTGRGQPEAARGSGRRGASRKTAPRKGGGRGRSR